MTDQSGAFPSTLREAEQALRDRHTTKLRVGVGDLLNSFCKDCYALTAVGDACDAHRWIFDSLNAIEDGAALERPRPAPPEPEVIREAMDCEFRRIGIHHPLEILHRVACCAADALQRVANPDLVRSGVPREETNRD